MTSSKQAIHVASAAQTEALGAMLAPMCKAGDCILLKGDLGSGKTTFARGFIRALCGAQTEVVSPTFNLVQHYPLTKEGTAVWHFDLYRLKSPAELRELGLEDALMTGISLIEWPEMAEQEVPEPLVVEMAQADGREGRRIVFRKQGSKWAAFMDRLNQQKDCA